MPNFQEGACAAVCISTGDRASDSINPNPEPLTSKKLDSDDTLRTNPAPFCKGLCHPAKSGFLFLVQCKSRQGHNVSLDLCRVHGLSPSTPQTKTANPKRFPKVVTTNHNAVCTEELDILNRES